MMKTLLYTLFASTLLFSCGSSSTQENNNEKDSINNVSTDETAESEQKIKSPRMQASGTIDGITVSIDYGSPSVRGRAIWGDLVPYDKVWRAGANAATAITFSDNVFVNGAEVKAGTYALFIIPKENKPWTIIFNEEWSEDLHGVWGAYDYKPEKDVLQFDVTPTWSEDVTESLSFSVSASGVKFNWEKATFEFTIAKK